MPSIVIIIAIIGFLGIVAGVFALRANWLKVKLGESNNLTGRWLWFAMLIGIVLGISSWPLTYFIGYSIHIEAQVGRVVGFPFFVAYFDNAGRDYVGPLTLPGVIANCIFWFLIPQLALRFSNYVLRFHNSST